MHARVNQRNFRARGKQKQEDERKYDSPMIKIVRFTTLMIVLQYRSSFIVLEGPETGHALYMWIPSGCKIVQMLLAAMFL